ncbi:tetratricopeptide repeat protein, partial [Akkermansia muciniphila]|uniref:tetratricopeptide repeat protein n=1 Tax=Akkermansia muciniphila TaxID=239935 RepID=UPI001BFF38E8
NEEALLHYKKSLKGYNRILKINPADDASFANKGIVLSNLGKQKEALKCYIQALKINKDNKIAKQKRRSLIGSQQFWESLSGNSRIDLWSGDDDFNTLASREKLKDCSSKDLSCIHRLWVEQYRILYLLSADLKQVGHYTSSSVFEILLQEEGETKGKAAPLRLCSVAAANDPTEGTVFLSLLHKNCIPSPRIQSDLSVLQTSFSSAIDSLNQFRLYGKKDGEEGTGLCLVFNRDFFAAPGEVSLIAVKREEEQFLKEETETGHKLPLYWVLYYDCESGHVYYTPACTEHSLNRELEMTEDSFRKSDRKRVKNIGESLKRIRYYFKSISKKYQQTALEMLIYLRHLVKDAAFKDEKELRILSLHPYNDSSLKVLTGKNCLSVNYLPVIHDKEEYLNQVIAGPKLKDFTNLVDVAKFRLHHLGGKKEVEFRQSRTPLS